MKSDGNRFCCNRITLYLSWFCWIGKYQARKKVVPLCSIPDLGMTTKTVTIAVGGHMTIRKWISTTNPFTNATQNAFRHKSSASTIEDWMHSTQIRQHFPILWWAKRIWKLSQCIHLVNLDTFINNLSTMSPFPLIANFFSIWYYENNFKRSPFLHVSCIYRADE